MATEEDQELSELRQRVALGADGGWGYRGEGGANLVVSIAKDRTVVRFIKSKYAGLKDQVGFAKPLMKMT
jgi:hypothetical protein